MYPKVGPGNTWERMTRIRMRYLGVVFLVSGTLLSIGANVADMTNAGVGYGEKDAQDRERGVGWTARPLIKRRPDHSRHL